MKLLLLVCHPQAGSLVAGLANACARQAAPFACFFTGDGVRTLDDPEVVRAVSAARSAIACEYSWARWRTEAPCPVDLGSQTDHSALAGECERVVSL